MANAETDPQVQCVLRAAARKRHTTLLGRGLTKLSLRSVQAAKTNLQQHRIHTRFRMMDYATRLAQAKAYSAMPPKDNLPQQKFKRGSFVKVSDEMPPWKSHFQKGFLGVVAYTYAQKYGGKNIDDYCLIQLSDEGIPINSISWYNEDQLTLIDGDTASGIALAERYESEF